MSNPKHDGATQQQIAKLVGVSDRTIRNYLTEAIWTRIKQRRIEVVQLELEAVDRAVYQKAVAGNIQAARLIYARWEQLKQEEGRQTSTESSSCDIQSLSLDELEDKLATVQAEILTLERDLTST